jgi:hypothetical protein
MRFILERLEDNGKQTIGVLKGYIDGSLVFECKTLELPYKDNERNISSIPEGKYKVTHRTSEKYGRHFHILDVPERSYILIHTANYVRQLRGCIAVGVDHIDIDGDGLKDVTSSKATLNTMLDIAPAEFTLTIKKKNNNMKFLASLLKNKELITGLFTGVSKLIKDHKGKPSAKRMFGLIGGGSMVTTGLSMIESGDCNESLYVGFGLTVLGAVVGLIMGAYISKEA